jgi:perosamine synthetase
MQKFIPVNRPQITYDHVKNVSLSLKKGWISGEGPFVSEYEKKFKNLIGTKYATTVSNGSTALEIAFSALKLKAGSKVILPSFSIVSCLNAIIKNNLKPIFVDVSKSDFNIDIEDLKKKINNNIKAVLLVHTYGLAANIPEILKLKKKYKFKVIEDCAEGLGLKFKSKYLGSFGDISTFSFYSNKLITAGEGGCILTNNRKYFDFCKNYKNLFFGKKERFKHPVMAGNYRMSSIQCAYASADLKFFKKNILKKKKIGNFYIKKLKNFDFIKLPPKKNLVSDNIFWVFPIVIINNRKINKNHFQNFLTKKKIGTRDFFYPLSSQPFLKKINIKYTHCKNSLYLYKNGLYLPCGLGNSYKEFNYVIKSIYEYKKKFFKR